MKDTGNRRFHFSGFKGHSHCVRAKAARLKTGDLTQCVEIRSSRSRLSPASSVSDDEARLLAEDTSDSALASWRIVASCAPCSSSKSFSTRRLAVVSSSIFSLCCLVRYHHATSKPIRNPITSHKNHITPSQIRSYHRQSFRLHQPKPRAKLVDRPNSNERVVSDHAQRKPAAAATLVMSATGAKQK